MNNSIFNNEKFQYLVNILVDEALQVLESYKNGSFGGTGIECAILADPRLAIDDYVFSHKGKDIAKNITKKLKDLKAKGDKDSQYLRALGDPGKMFRIKLLRDDEIFVINKKILRHKITILMRFPCSSAGENLRAKIINFDIIKKRIEIYVKLGKLKKFQSKMLLDIYRNTPNSVFIYSGSTRVKGLLGGMDNDTDGCMLMVGEDLKIFEGRISRSVDIPDELGKNINIKFANISELMTSVYLASLATGNTVVGVFCVYNSCASTVLQNLNNKKIIKKLQDNIDEEYEKEHGNAQYIRRYDDISDLSMDQVMNKKIEQMTLDFVGSDRSEQSIKNYLLDCLAVAPAVIGMIIDSAKTGLTVFDPLCFLLKDVEQARRNYTPTIIWNEQIAQFEVVEHKVFNKEEKVK
nr:MAG TPA: hypothetical protein [Caudoviricetes sp.]